MGGAHAVVTRALALCLLGAHGALGALDCRHPNGEAPTTRCHVFR